MLFVAPEKHHEIRAELRELIYVPIGRASAGRPYNDREENIVCKKINRQLPFRRRRHASIRRGERDVGMNFEQIPLHSNPHGFMILVFAQLALGLTILSSLKWRKLL